MKKEKITFEEVSLKDIKNNLKKYEDKLFIVFFDCEYCDYPYQLARLFIDDDNENKPQFYFIDNFTVPGEGETINLEDFEAPNRHDKFYLCTTSLQD